MQVLRQSIAQIWDFREGLEYLKNLKFVKLGKLNDKQTLIILLLIKISINVLLLSKSMQYYILYCILLDTMVGDLKTRVISIKLSHFFSLFAFTLGTLGVQKYATMYYDYPP